MGKILIIDDDKLFSTELKEKLQVHFDDEIMVFNEVDYNYLNHHVLDLVFLDIEMGAVNGIVVAKELRTRKDNPLVIFVSSKEGLIHNSLEAQPFYFVRKESLDMDLNSAFSLLKSANFRVRELIKIADQIVDVGQLKYIESDNHYLTLVMTNSTTLVRITMEEVSKLLENYLCVRIHRSIVVNLRYVERLYSNRAVLKNGKELEVGRKYQLQAKHLYQEAKLNGFI